MMTADDYRRAIKAYCISCAGGCRTQAKACEITQCPLWPMTDWHHKRIKKQERRTVGVQLTMKIYTEDDK